MIQNIIATLIGIIVAIAIVAAVEALSHMLYPPPMEILGPDRSAFIQAIAALPIAAKLLVLAAWALGSFGGALVAIQVARWRQDIPVSAGPALITGTFVQVATVFMLIQIPHPLWMAISSQIFPLPLAWLAYRLGTKT